MAHYHLPKSAITTLRQDYTPPMLCVLLFYGRVYFERQFEDFFTLKSFCRPNLLLFLRTVYPKHLKSNTHVLAVLPDESYSHRALSSCTVLLISVSPVSAI